MTACAGGPSRRLGIGGNEDALVHRPGAAHASVPEPVMVVYIAPGSRWHPVRQPTASISAQCRREGIAESLYYSWSKEFLEVGKKRLAGDKARQANTGEVKNLKHEMRADKHRSPNSAYCGA